MKILRYSASALCLFAGTSVPNIAAAQNSATWAPCKAPVEIAKRAYVRIQQAKTKALGHERKDAFWDVHEFAHNCPEVSTLAAQLQSAGFGKNSPAPKDSINILQGGDSYGLPSSCGPDECKILITKSGKGNSAGMEISNLYVLDQAATGLSSSPAYKWRQLETQKLPVQRGHFAGTPK